MAEMMTSPTNQIATPCFTEVLKALVAKRELTAEQIQQVMEAMMSGQCPEAEASAFLVGLRMKGETAGEIAAAVQILRQHMVRWDPGIPGVLDTCGTGGDGLGTFNISTATAIVVAACGVPVVKHGNRSVSSRSGSADVLINLGVSIEGDGTCARRCLEEANLAFCFAPLYHPALKHVAPIRQRLGIPTIFNCLGPLANPAAVDYQLLGVGRAELLDLMAGALAILGTKRALIVHGTDGLDEVSLSAPTQVRQIVGNQIKAWEWLPEDFGLPRCELAELQAEDASASAEIVKTVVQGRVGPATDIVLANAAAALLAANQVDNPWEGVDRARKALRSGKAAEVLEKLIQATRG